MRIELNVTEDRTFSIKK